MTLAISISRAQSIDTAALSILQKSYDRLAAMEYISYRLDKQDTMIREGRPLTVTESSMKGSIKKGAGAFWHLDFGTRSSWLLKSDTLYKKTPASASQSIYSTSWNNHELAAFSIYNLLGEERPKARANISSLRLVAEEKNDKFFIIDVVNKRLDYGTAEIQSLAYFNRYYIDRQTFLPLRRMMYSKRLESGKIAIDIYDFSVKIDLGEMRDFFPDAFLKGGSIQESEKKGFEMVHTGTLASPFLASSLSSGKKTILPAMKGKVVLLDFWYLSCMPCRILMPKIQRLSDKFKRQGLEVMGVNVRDSSATEIRDFLFSRGIGYHQFYKPGLTQEDYRLYAYPTTILIGADGRIKLVETGDGPDTESRLARAISKALSISLKDNSIAEDSGY